MGMPPFTSDTERIEKFPFTAMILAHESCWITISSAAFQVTADLEAGGKRAFPTGPPAAAKHRLQPNTHPLLLVTHVPYNQSLSQENALQKPARLGQVWPETHLG